jgi:hypothetical protein
VESSVIPADQPVWPGLSWAISEMCIGDSFPLVDLLLVQILVTIFTSLSPKVAHASLESFKQTYYIVIYAPMIRTRPDLFAEKECRHLFFHAGKASRVRERSMNFFHLRYCSSLPLLANRNLATQLQKYRGIVIHSVSRVSSPEY